MGGDDEKNKKSFLSWLGVFFGGVFTALATLFISKRNNTNITKGLNDTRGQLNDVREQLKQTEGNINDLEGTINSSERAIRESREILNRVREEHKQGVKK